jgi:hypothetical protein
MSPQPSPLSAGYKRRIAGPERAPAIGAWLADVRRHLEQGQPVDLTRGLPPGVTFKQVIPADNLFQIQGNTCRYFQCDRQESVIAIHKGSQEYKSKCHTLAKTLAGKFSSIEEIGNWVTKPTLAKILGWHEV